MATKKTTRKTKKTTRKTNKSLEAKIAELEGKLSKLSAQQGQKPAEPAKAPPPPPPKASPPPPPKPAEAPKPAPKAQAAPPATLESLYESVPVGNWNERKAKTPAFVSENARAWARRHATGADAPTQSWILQKAKITGYTAPSNKYFATRQRLAHHPFHPENKNFLGYGISLGHGTAQTQTLSAPPPPQQTQGKLPKGTAASSGGTGKSRKQELEDYEKDYLARLDIQEAEAVAEVEQTQASSSQKHGSLPKGFTPQSAPPPPPKPQEKYAKGLLPKGS